MIIEEKQQEYLRLLHALQTGVAYMMEKNPEATTPKHLRVGVNSAMCNNAALVNLLIKKDIFTEDEWWDSLIEAVQDEINDYEIRLSELYGAKITLK